MDQYKVAYTEEAHELIIDMEKALLELEQDPKNLDLIQHIFRIMHTLKGNSAMFGLSLITELTHHLESIYEFIRSGQQNITKEILDITLSSLDHLSSLISSGDVLNELMQDKHNKLCLQVAAILHQIQIDLNTHVTIERPITKDTENNASIAGLKTYRIYFSPEREVFFNGTDPLYLFNELQEIGKCDITANTDEVPLLEDLDTSLCYTSWNIILQTEAEPQQVREIFLFVEENCKLEISIVPAAITPPIELKTISVKAIKKEVDFPATEFLSRNKKNIISSIRVPSERLDNMMSQVSELMTLQAKLAILTEQYPHAELLAVTENLEKISARLRDNAFNMCLIPINSIITPFSRMVRDLASSLDKEIEFTTEGTETELDKNIMEGLSDPLMHLLRNSVDHGIEFPEERVKAGKHRIGTINFKAYCSGNNVFIEIQDDGKGIDPEKIKAKAISEGIISKGDILNEKEIFNLVFLPGFTTASQISEVSGRGVGMDVVKQKITDIRGQIKISSKLAAGTTITMKLPLTISIMDGLLVKVNKADFVIPLSAVERCFEIYMERNLKNINKVIELDGEQIPFISLNQEFTGTESTSNTQQSIIVCYEEKKVALIVDTIVGKFQAVLKPLGKYFNRMDNISGATILGDGNIALVLDTNKVIEQHLDNKRFSICQ